MKNTTAPINVNIHSKYSTLKSVRVPKWLLEVTQMESDNFTDAIIALAERGALDKFGQEAVENAKLRNTANPVLAA